MGGDVPTDAGDEDDRDYAPPELVDYGTIEELTAGAGGNGGDAAGSSFKK